MEIAKVNMINKIFKTLTHFLKFIKNFFLQTQTYIAHTIDYSNKEADLKQNNLATAHRSRTTWGLWPISLWQVEIN